MTPALLDKLPREWPPAQPAPHWHLDPVLAPALAACREATRTHATTFFFASRLLPEQKKCAAYAVYAFCRWVDDTFDAVPPSPSPSSATPDASSLGLALDEMLGGKSPLPFAPAFAAVSREYGIHRDLYLDLIEGCARDRVPARLTDLADLEVYSYHVASVVGLIMSRIFGLRDAAGLPRAAEMGLAMQLTNILRDVREDYALGRVYLPAEDLARFSVTEDHLRSGRVDDNWRNLMRFEITRARDWYASAEHGLALLDNDGSRRTAQVMGRVYAGILGAIERRNYDVFSSRCYVPTWRKCFILARCFADS